MTTTVVVRELLKTLPFYDALGWQQFESLCADVLYRKYDSISTREYLNPGNDQQGIDVYSVPRKEEKISVAQCKLVKRLTPNEILAIIEDFLHGAFADKTNQFILCTNLDLTSLEDESETINNARIKLAEKGIELKVWDNRGLSLELRTDPTPAIINIVYRYFKEDICLAFYGDIWKEYLQQLIPTRKKKYEFEGDYIERTIVSYNNRLKSPAIAPFGRPSGLQTVSCLIESNEPINKKMVLLSIAGFGKSAEIKKLAAFYADDNKYLFPFKYSLINYSGQSIDQLLNSFLADWKNITGDQLLLLFDGLDEISDQFFDKFIAAINEFTEQYPKCKCIVSSRYNFYNLRHAPLFEFDAYLLNPLTTTDIESYIVEKLGGNKTDFEQKIASSYFAEYLTNPYYLSRLIRFYQAGDAFPANKTELFDKILFEQINKDERTYQLRNLKEKIFPMAGRIAFCMALAGKLFVTEEEMKQIIPEEVSRNLLKRCRILNLHNDETGSWSFEHKNLQEYLCATVFAVMDFDTVLPLISYKQDSNRLLPAFLNTLSFLFELLDRESVFFNKLFTWISENDREILIRFEKDKLSLANRHLIFRNIFNYYQSRQITLRVSSNFDYRELANFAPIDENLLDFLQMQLHSDTSANIQYDALNMIACCQSAYLYKQKIKAILFSVLHSSSGEPFIEAKAITTFADLGFTSKDIFNEILQSGVDTGEFEIRKATLYFLKTTDYYQDFIQYILASISILENGQRLRNQSGSFFIVNEMLLSVKDPVAVKLILQYCINDQQVIHRRSVYREFTFNTEEVAQLLDNAASAYQQDNTILRFVYRLYLRTDYYMFDERDSKPFISFFEKTCGKKIIFKKFYRYSSLNRNLLAFADEGDCDFIIAEYEKGVLSANEIKAFRNRLSWISKSLYDYFSDNIKKRRESNLLPEDEGVDYQVVRMQQLIKNQQMLLDKELFMAEAKTIFSLIPKKEFSASDLWQSATSKMRLFESSVAYAAIRNACVNGFGHTTTQEDFFADYANDAYWNAFAVEAAFNIIKEKDKEKEPTLLELVLFLEKWCVNRIAAIDFKNVIQGDSIYFTSIPQIEFVKDVFLLLRPTIPNDLLLKMLPADYETFNALKNENPTIGLVVIEKVVDKKLLYKTITDNIRKERLAVAVRCSHFALCCRLRYKDVLPDLYETIITETTLSDEYRIRLCEYYVELGGQYIDFRRMLKLPDISNEQAVYVSFEWFLMEKLLFVLSPEIESLLLDVIQKDKKNAHKLKAIEYLLQLSKVEGLVFWETYVRETKTLPFEHRWQNLQPGVSRIPPGQSMSIFFSVLDFAYINNLQDGFAGDHFINECIYNPLTAIALKSAAHYNTIMQKMDEMIIAYEGKPVADTIKYFLERLKQRYFESLKQEITISEANETFKRITHSHTNWL